MKTDHQPPLSPGRCGTASVSSKPVSTGQIKQDLILHRHVQQIARSVLEALPEFMTADSTEASIAAAAQRLLADRGITRTWYYRVPAVVLAGSRSCRSISGRLYKPADEPIGGHNLITVDLSPEFDGVWGDCARSFPIENGRFTPTPNDPEFQRGLATLSDFHSDMKRFVTRQTTFHELHGFGTAWLRQRGYECIDFRSNFGHSIGASLDDRIFVGSGNYVRLADAGLFTFEPHIRTVASAPGRWGFKLENMYYFGKNNEACEV